MIRLPVSEAGDPGSAASPHAVIEGKKEEKEGTVPSFNP